MCLANVLMKYFYAEQAKPKKADRKRKNPLDDMLAEGMYGVHLCTASALSDASQSTSDIT